MWWKLFQAAVFSFMVIFIIWSKVDTGGPAIGVAALMVTYLATLLLARIIDGTRWIIRAVSDLASPKSLAAPEAQSTPLGFEATRSLIQQPGSNLSRSR